MYFQFSSCGYGSYIHVQNSDNNGLIVLIQFKATYALKISFQLTNTYLISQPCLQCSESHSFPM